MTKLSKELWDKICGNIVYDADTYCLMVLEIFEEGGSMADFYVRAGVSPQRVGHWLREHDEFFEAVQLAKEIGKQRWLKEASDNIDNKEFNRVLWSALGKRMFGNSDKVSLWVKAEDTPVNQYKQLISQAANGDFTASELKQLMEAVNIGLRAHEVCELQNEINELKEGLKQMEERELEHQSSDNPATKENQTSVASKDGEQVHS